MLDTAFSTLNITNRIANNQEGDEDHYAQKNHSFTAM
jgi:hypothetical protein